MQWVIFVFFTHLFLLCWCEIILNVKSLPDFLWGFSFDHVGYCFACDIKQTFDIQVVGSLKEIHEKNNFSAKDKFWNTAFIHHLYKPLQEIMSPWTYKRKDNKIDPQNIKW